MMQQGFPFLIGGGLTEAGRMGFKDLPTHQQDVFVFPFQTTLKFMRNIAIDRGNDRLGLAECCFKIGGLTRLNR